MMGVQQCEEAPKGLRSLPRELRDNIYKLVLLPEPRRPKHCTVLCLSGAHLASTHRPAGMQSLCMDINSICSPPLNRGQFTSKLDQTAPILLACRQIFQEASQVLYENTELLLQPEPWPFSFKIVAFDQILIDCPTYALQHIRVVSLAFMSGRRDSKFLGGHLLVDRLRLPNLKLVKLHFDMDTEAPNATRFEFLCAIADHVELVVEVHITSIFVDGGTGWAEQLLDTGGHVDVNQSTYAAAWAAAKEKAFEMRAAFVKDLGAIFQQYGKKLKVKEK
ncbi:hypothetical protein AC579_7678 [Pseudocercospora musae]|uniref:F-box domain-containing protein n=1 Tax=Pseudocercospora musae TaxID=113226 RepID=A0A139IBK5_9PEZI|nr:hypothetical protein AC579_7678 [Pseudocercospora musae]